MIIHTGNRTDIPAFYSQWFRKRLEEGYVLVRNPYYPEQVTRYQLSPDVVDLFVFCTKNPSPMLEHMDLLKPYGQYWYVTITPYGKDMEPFVPEKRKVLEDFQRLSTIVGKERVGWRYDPILINEKYTLEYHLRAFRTMAETLRGYTETCVISFIDLYEKVKRNFPEVREVTYEERQILGKVICEIAAENGMTVRPCAEGNDLAQYGAECSGCMTVHFLEKAIHGELHVPSGKAGQRGSHCACILGADIGAYNTCGHLCRYCYANVDSNIVCANMQKHDPDSPLLLGRLQETDTVRIAEQKSWLERQLSLEL